MELSDVMKSVHAERAANAIVTLSPDKWAGWIVYLLEAIESKAGAGGFDSVLLDVAGAISERLEEGRW